MRRMLTCLSLVLTITVTDILAQTPAHLWSRGFGAGGGNAVATDPSGNVLVVGDFSGTANFGGGALVSAGTSDIFIAKYSPSGEHLWSKRFGSDLYDIASGVATDAAGNVFVTGQFNGTVNFGGGNLISAGYGDVFVAEYSAAGAHLWSRGFGDAQADDSGVAIATDTSGNVLIAGLFSGTVDCGGGNLVSAGGSDIFIAKYTPTGSHVWSQRFGSTGQDTARRIAIDASGDVFVAGTFMGTVNFGGAGLVSAGALDIFLAKFGAGGTHLWSQRIGDATNDYAVSVATDASGNLFATGWFDGTVDFGGGNLASAGGVDIFLAKYSPTGTHLWSNRFGGTSDDNGLSVATDLSGNVFVTGGFQNTANFGGGALVSAGSYDMFVATYSPAGAHVRSRRYGGAALDVAEAIATDDPGNMVIVGYALGTLDLGGGNLLFDGGGFVVKYANTPAEPVITSIVDIGNDQGRKVRIRFDRSGNDDRDAPAPVTRYVALRRDDTPPSSAAQLSRRIVLDSGWTQVGSVDAFGTSDYGIDVPTVGDSTITLGPYYSHFFIRAATATPTMFYDSAPDSGYSLDNLAPAVPQNFVYNAGDLAWDESKAADFDFFTVYGSNTDSFGAATVVDYSVTPAMDVTSSPYVFYFVTATDFSGNEGKPAKVNTLSGVGGTPKSYVLSVSNYPNPFNPATTVSYTVPASGAVTVAIYDARGAQIATLVSREHAAGAYTIEWNGRTNAGVAVSSGIYFVRIDQNGATRSKKITLLK